jgi:hypothetical protein
MPVNLFGTNLRHVPTMSYASKPQRVKRKGAVRELKLTQHVNRHGSETLRAEEVKTPRRSSQPASTSQLNRSSASPNKRPKQVDFDGQPIPCYLEDADRSKKRQTLVFLFPHLCLTIPDYFMLCRAKTTFCSSF